MRLRPSAVGAGRAARTHRVPRPWRAVAAAIVALAFVLGSAGPAAAHAVLRESQPADGDRLESGPTDITLRFNQDAQEGFGSVVVVGPNGGQWQDGDPRVSGPTVTQPLRTLGPAGTYEVSWRVISADGHPVSGTFDFAVSSAGGGTPLPESAEAGADEGGASWLWLAGGIALGAVVLAGVVVLATTMLSRRGRSRRSAP